MQATPELPEGHVAMLRDLEVRDAEGVLRPVAERYAQWFRAPPLQSAYLVLLVPGDSNDGGAFSNRLSQVLPADAGRDTRVLWGHTMAHELLHLWNGLAMVPATADKEWLKGGVTDYLTLTAEGQLGLATRSRPCAGSRPTCNASSSPASCSATTRPCARPGTTSRPSASWCTAAARPPPSRWTWRSASKAVIATDCRT